MKVLQLVTQRQYRGAEVFAANLSNSLIAEGVEILFVGLYPPPENELRVERAKNIDLNGQKKGFVSFSALRRLLKLLQAEKPDIIQANGSDTLKYCYFAKYFFPRIPVVYRNISMISAWLGNSRIKTILYKQLFSKIDHINSVGKMAIDDLKQAIGYPHSKTSVIRRAIPRQILDKHRAAERLRAELGLYETDKIVVHIGNFSPEKNHVFLIEAFKKIRISDPDVKLLLVGEGKLYNAIANAIVEDGMQSTIYMLGFRSDVQQIIAGTDLMVLCSKVEGVPGVLLEGAAQKVPSVAIDVGGVGEVVIDDETGILLPGFDLNEFIRACTALLNNQTQLMKLGEGAFKKVVQEYDPSTNTEKFLDLYQSLIKSS